MSDLSKTQLAMLSVYGEYLANGLYLVPIAPEWRTGKPTKGPVKAGWNSDENIIRNPNQIKTAWLTEGWNVGLALLQSNIVSFDIDEMEKTRQVFADILDFDLDELLNAPDAVRVTGKPNRAKLLYRVPGEFQYLTTQQLKFGGMTILEIRYKAKDKEVDGKIEKGKTAQDVLPPSIHPDTGKPYEWIGDWTSIPEVPQILADLWANWDEMKPVMLELDPTYEPPPTRPDRPPRALQQGEISPIDEYNQTTCIGSILNRHGYKQRGKRFIHPGSQSGIPGVSLLSRDGTERVYSHNAGDPLNDGHAHDAFDVYRILEHNGDESAAIHALANELTTSAGITITQHNQRAYMASKQDEEPAQAFDASKVYKAPTAANDPLEPIPGELQRVASWMMETTFRTNAELAQLGALALASTLAGRMYKTETGSFSSTLSIAVAPTGGGKDFIKKSVNKVLNKAGLNKLIGPSSLTSEAAVRAMLYQSPTKFMVLDEIGDKLKRAMGGDANEKAAFDSFKEVYSNADGLWTERGYAAQKRDPDSIRNHEPLHIFNPNLTLVGLTTPDQLAGALQAEHFEGGFLNRFTVVVSSDEFTVRRTKRPESEPPSWIVTRARAIRDKGVKGDRIGNLATIDFSDASVEAIPVLVAVDQDAEAAMHAYWHANEIKYKHSKLETELSARLHENAMRMALSITVFNDQSRARVTKELYIWCTRWLDVHFQRFVNQCRRYQVASPWDEKRQRILQALQAAGAMGVSLSDMNRQPGIYSTGKLAERGELLAELSLMGLAMQAADTRADGKGGRGQVRWYAVNPDYS